MKKLITFSLIAISVQLYAQDKEMVLGIQAYKNFDYSESIAYLEHVPEKDASVLRKLGDAYDHVGKYDQAEHCYAEACQRMDRIPNDHLRYAKLLMKNKRYNEAEEQLKKYQQLNPGDRELEKYTQLLSSLKKYDELGKTIRVEDLAINTDQQDFAPFVMNGKVYFSSSRNDKVLSERKWVGNHLPFLDVYQADLDNNSSNLANPVFIKNKKLNSKYHDGPITVSADGKEMFITRNNYAATSADGTRNFSLYVSQKQGENWSDPVALPFNSSEYSVGHGSLSPDGQTLYFASDMPGGKGGVDIYVSHRMNGTWSVPENLAEVNTSGDEMFPYAHPSGILFFASNGWLGYGGLDIFIGELKDTGIKQIRNVGAPFNSEADDFGVWMGDDAKHGLFSSNRSGGKGSDDIYSFAMDKPFSFGRKINVLVMDENDKPLPQATVYLRDSMGNTLDSLESDNKAMVVFTTDQIGNFELAGSKKDYFRDSAQFAITDQTEEELAQKLKLEKDPGFQLMALIRDKKSKQILDSVKVTCINNLTGKEEIFYLNKEAKILRPIYDMHLGDRISYQFKLERKGYMTKELTYNKLLDKPGVYDASQELDFGMTRMEVGADLAKLIDLKPIYFDYAKFNIRPDAAIELDKIVKIMNEYPTMTVELGSHTDCRGSAAKNLELSEKRAKASADYIKARITNPDRISGRGYGESKILNGCTCEGPGKQPKYTEAQHAENRRTEFLILKM